MSFLLALLIILLILIVESRVFYPARMRRDSLSLLFFLPFALTLSYIYVFTLDLTSLLLFIPSVLLLPLNFQCATHFASSLYIDGFSASRKCISLFILIYTMMLLILMNVFMPRDLFRKKEIVKSEERFSSASSGKLIKTLDFERDNAILYTYSSPSKNAEGKVVIFLHDFRSRLSDWEELFAHLVKRCSRVYALSLYTEEAKCYKGILGSGVFARFTMMCHYLLGEAIEKLSRKKKFDPFCEFYTFKSLRSLEVLLTLVKEKEGENVRVIAAADETAKQALKDFMNKYPKNISSVVYLGDYKGYKYKGFALVERSEPLLALILDKVNGTSERKGMENREKNMYDFASFILSQAEEKTPLNQ